MVQAIDGAYDMFSPRSFREVLCPDVFRLKKYYARKKQRRSFSRFIYDLKAGGYLREKEVKNQRAFVITLKGVQKISMILRKTRTFSKRKDRRLQMIMYDIPEDEKDDREHFRNELLYLGYSKLQKSVWVSPYDVFKQTQQLIQNYHFSKYVRLF